jgi:hypothetical protein
MVVDEQNLALLNASLPADKGLLVGEDKENIIRV